MRQVGVGVRKRRRAKRNLFVHETDFVRRMRLRMCVCVFIVVQWGLCIYIHTNLARDLHAGAVRVTCCVGGGQKSGCGAEDEREKGTRHKVRGGPKDLVCT